MILLGINGGMRQGKSTVGAELRHLAGVDTKADLEFSYPVGQVADLWVRQWAPSVLESGLKTIEIANKLIPLIAEPVEQVTGYKADVDRLVIEDTAASKELNNRLLSYIERYVEAGEHRGEEFPTPITPDNKVLHRALYQWIGARLIDEVEAGAGHDIWSRVIEKRIATLKERGYALITVGGTRYPHQQQVIRDLGGYIIDVERPGMAEDSDVTERVADDAVPDIKVVNNGTLEQLNDVVKELYQDLINNNIRKVYKAAA